MTPFAAGDNWEVHHADCLDAMADIPDSSVDAVITDPPYAEVKRDYGRWTEAEWWELIVEGVVPEVRRILKPQGSAVFIVQPNSRKVGSMRGWVFEFMAWVCREWNMVQDAYWWNWSAAPSVHCHAANGLMRPSLKPCVWCGPTDCYRSQSEVLLPIADATLTDKRLWRFELTQSDSGWTRRQGRALQRCRERGGSTPFNVMAMGNGAQKDSHGAGTPLPLARWWTRYICPPGGTVLDPFFGAGTMGVAAIEEGRNIIGIERNQEYCEIARARIEHAEPASKTAGEPVQLQIAGM